LWKEECRAGKKPFLRGSKKWGFPGEKKKKKTEKIEWGGDGGREAVLHTTEGGRSVLKAKKKGERGPGPAIVNKRGQKRKKKRVAHSSSLKQFKKKGHERKKRKLGFEFRKKDRTFKQRGKLTGQGKKEEKKDPYAGRQGGRRPWRKGLPKTEKRRRGLKGKACLAERESPKKK